MDILRKEAQSKTLHWLAVRLNETFLVGFIKEIKTLRLDSLLFEKNGFSNGKFTKLVSWPVAPTEPGSKKNIKYLNSELLLFPCFY